MNTQEYYNLLEKDIDNYFNSDQLEISDLIRVTKLIIIKLMYNLEYLPMTKEKDISFQKLISENITV